MKKSKIVRIGSRMFVSFIIFCVLSMVVVKKAQADAWHLLGGYSGGVEHYDGITGIYVSPFSASVSSGISSYGDLICIGDYNASRVYRYNTSGAYLGELIVPLPIGVAFDAFGYLYVTEGGNGNVQKYNLDGSFNSTFASGLSGPRGICISSDGTVYVACAGSSNVRRFQNNGQEITPALVPGSIPYSVAWGPDNSLYVGATVDGTVRKVNVWDLTYTVVVNGIQAYDLEIGPDRNLYIANLFGYRVDRYNLTTGTYEVFSTPQGSSQCYALGFYSILTVDSRLLAGYQVPNTIEYYSGFTGGHRGRFVSSASSGISSYGNLICIANYTAGRVYRYDTNGAYLGELIVPGPLGVAFDASGYLYVTENGNGNVQKYNPDGSFNSTFASGLIGPRGICVASNGTVYVACTGSNNVRRFQSNGQEITPALQSGSVPYSVAAAPDGYLYVGATLDSTLRQVNVGNDTYATVANVAAYDLEIGPDGNLYVASLSNSVYIYNITDGTYKIFSSPAGPPSNCSALGFYYVGTPAIAFSGAVRSSADSILYGGSTVPVDVIVNNHFSSSKVIDVTYQLLDYKEQVIWSQSKQYTIPPYGNAFDSSLSIIPGQSGIFKLQAAYSTPGAAGTEDVTIFGILPQTSSVGENTPDTNSRFGVHTRLGPNYEPNLHLGAAKKTGMKWVRLMDFDITTWWTTVEPSNNTWVWYDANIDNAIANGMTVLGMLVSTPRWASSEPTGSQDYYAYRSWPAIFISDFSDYVTNVVNHYKDRIKHWEVWNEADIAGYWGFWNGTPEQYAQYVQEAYTAAKTADPTCTILSGGAFIWLTNGFQRSFYAAGGLKDILSFHPYPNFPPAFKNPAYYHARIDFVKDIMSQYGTVKPMWGTETAIMMGSTWYRKLPIAGLKDESAWIKEPPSWSASDMLKMYSINFARGIEKVFYYYLSYADPNNAEYYQSLWEYDGAPTSRLMSHAAMSYVLKDATIYDSAKLGSKVFGHVYSKSTGGSVAILWSEIDGGTTITLSGSPSSFTRKDIMGNTVALPSLTLLLSSEPFYLISDTVTASNMLSRLNANPKVEIEGSVVVARSDGSVYLESGTDLTERAMISLGAAPSALAVRPNGDVVVAKTGGYVYLKNGSNLGSMASWNAGATVTLLAVQQDNDVVAAKNNGYVYLRSGTNLGAIASWNSGGIVNVLGTQPDDDVVIGGDNGYVYLRSGTNLSAIASFNAYVSVASLGIQSNGNVVVARGGGYVFLLNGSNLSQIASYNPYGDCKILVQPNDNVLVVRNDGWVFLLNGSNLTEISRWCAYLPTAKSGIQPDGDMIFARNDGSVFWVRGSDLAQQIYSGSFGVANNMVIENDGDIVLSNTDNRVYIIHNSNLEMLAIKNMGGTISYLAVQRVVR